MNYRMLRPNFVIVFVKFWRRWNFQCTAWHSARLPFFAPKNKHTAARFLFICHRLRFGKLTEACQIENTFYKFSIPAKCLFILPKRKRTRQKKIHDSKIPLGKNIFFSHFLIDLVTQFGDSGDNISNHSWIEWSNDQKVQIFVIEREKKLRAHFFFSWENVIPFSILMNQNISRSFEFQIVGVTLHIFFSAPRITMPYLCKTIVTEN